MYWIWVLIPLVAIITKFILDFQKNQVELSRNNKFTEDKVEKLSEEFARLTRRIENLETIAATDPNEFVQSDIEQSPVIDELKDEKEINQDIINKMAQKRRNKS